MIDGPVKPNEEIIGKVKSEDRSVSFPGAAEAACHPGFIWRAVVL